MTREITDVRSEAEVELTKFLELFAKVRRECQRPEGWAYEGPEDFLLKHGRWYEPRPLPAGTRLGAPRSCYGNSILAARLNPNLTYVEGYAQKFIPVQHAWCVDRAGQIYELTWPEPGTAYVGVEFSLGRADNSTWDGDASVLGDPRPGITIYEKPWTGEDFSRKWEPTEGMKLIEEKFRGRIRRAEAAFRKGNRKRLAR